MACSVFWRLDMQAADCRKGGWGDWSRSTHFFLFLGSEWGWRSVTWPTIGCCLNLKVFLGAYNDPFRMYLVSQSLSLAPEVLHFVFERQLRSSVCLPLPFDWPGMLERGMSTDCLKQNLACCQLGGLFIFGRGRTKSTKRARSQQ